ncbi:MAG TPA: DUF86 domain-containing protein [Nitrospirota bacterium]
MVDKTVVLRKVSELETYLRQVREYSGITLADYRADWKTQRIVERTLQMMIETCADVASHIVSDRGMRAPTSYADTFTVLGENAVIAPEIVSVMEKMAKFRNIVVHQYEGADAEIVIAILKKHLEDFTKFKDSILKYMRSSDI